MRGHTPSPRGQSLRSLSLATFSPTDMPPLSPPGPARPPARSAPDARLLARMEEHQESVMCPKRRGAPVALLSTVML